MSSDSFRGLLRRKASFSPLVFSSGRHFFLLRFSRWGGASTSLGLLLWAASLPPSVFSSARRVLRPRFSQVVSTASSLGFFDGGRLFPPKILRRGAPQAPSCRGNFQKLSIFRSRDRRPASSIARSVPLRFRTFDPQIASSISPSKDEAPGSFALSDCRCID